MAVTWLHLSDIHFRRTDTYERDVVLESLVQSVRRFREVENRRPDLVFVTGDIGWHGKADDYEKIGDFFDALLPAAGLTRRELFVVPGNHDVDRDQCLGLSPTLVSAKDSDAYFAPGRQKFHITIKQAPFVAWYNQYFRGIRRFEIDSSCGPVEQVTIRGERIAILPINTALFCAGDDDKGKLWIGHRALASAVKTLESCGATLSLALMHHPLDWLADGEGLRVKATLSSVVNVILCGHLHKSDVEVHSNPDGSVLHLEAGAIYQSQIRRALYVTVANGNATVFPIRHVDDRIDAWVHDTGCFPRTPGYQAVVSVPRMAKGAANVMRGPVMQINLGEVIHDKPYRHPQTRVEMPRDFFGRQDVIEHIIGRLTNKEERQPIIVQGERRMGKTSLLRVIGQKLRDEYANDIVVVGSVFVGNQVEVRGFFECVFGEIYSALEQSMSVSSIPATRGDPKDADDFVKRIQTLLAHARPRTVVLILDEIDEVLEKETLTDRDRHVILSFLGHASANNGTLRLLLSSIRTPERFSRMDVIAYMGRSDVQPLQPFKDGGDFRDMLCACKEWRPPLTEPEMAQIYRFSGGWPFFCKDYRSLPRAGAFRCRRPGSQGIQAGRRG